MRDLDLSVYPQAESSDGDHLSESWDDFCTNLTELGFVERPEKKETPLLVPVTWHHPQSGKKKRNVQYVHLIGFDFDDLSDTETSEILDKFEAENLAGLVHSTYQDFVQELRRFRLLIPLSRPVQPSEWAPLWTIARQRYAPESDPSCKDPSRGYFLPSKPFDEECFPDATEPPHEPLFWVFPGDPLDVDAILSALDSHQSVRELASIEGTLSVSRADLRHLSTTWKRSSKPHRREMGELLKKLTEGIAFADEGERDTTCFKLSKDLARAFPNASPAAIAAHFETSLRDMGPDAPSIESIEEKIRRAQEENRTTEFEAARKQIEEVKTSGVTYNEKDLEPLLRRMRCKFEDLPNYLILQGADGYHILDRGKYIPTTRSTIWKKAKQCLPSATTMPDWGIEVHDGIDDRGLPRRRDPDTLVQFYGHVYDKTQIDLRAPFTYLDRQANVLVEAPAPLRPELEALNHPEVDAYIKAMVGDEAAFEWIRRWLSILPDLSQPLPMLSLYGASGTGKSLLANGIASIWTDKGFPTPFASLFGSFNDEFLTCPLIHLAENVPKSLAGSNYLDQTMDLITGAGISMRAKYKNPVTVTGCLRFIATANEQIFRPIGVNREKIAALLSRIQIIPIATDAPVISATAGHRLIKQIPEHILFLHRHRKPLEGLERLELKTFESSLPLLLERNPICLLVLNWIERFLRNPKETEAAYEREGDVYVNGRGLFALLKRDLPKDTNEFEFRDALNTLCDGKRHHPPMREGSRASQKKYRKISKRFLSILDSLDD